MVREFAIKGMHCDGCASAVTAAIQALAGVESVEVSLADKKAVVRADEAKVPAAKIEAAVRDAGFEAQSIGP